MGYLSGWPNEIQHPRAPSGPGDHAIREDPRALAHSISIEISNAMPDPAEWPGAPTPAQVTHAITANGPMKAMAMIVG